VRAVMLAAIGAGREVLAAGLCAIGYTQGAGIGLSHAAPGKVGVSDVGPGLGNTEGPKSPGVSPEVFSIASHGRMRVEAVFWFAQGWMDRT
jgi:hypothetical protein